MNLKDHNHKNTDKGCNDEISITAEPQSTVNKAELSIDTIAQLADVVSDSPTSSPARSSSVHQKSSTKSSSLSSSSSSAHQEQQQRQQPEADANEDDDSDSGELKIPFLPGDHITRWEMLPIAWPIQVHGIVLEVHEDSVILVDFGLAAVPEGINKKKNAKLRKEKEKLAKEKAKKEKVEQENAKTCDTEGNDSNDGNDKSTSNDTTTKEPSHKEQQQHVKKAIEKFQRGFKKERNRLNVQTLTTQKEISKWSKVNYDGGLFGFGNKDGDKNQNDGDGDNNNKDQTDGDNYNGDQSSTQENSPRKLKRESWWTSFKKSQERKKNEKERKKQEQKENSSSISSNRNSNNSLTKTSDETVATSGGVDLEIETAGSTDTPTNISGCGGMAACHGDETPWWCRLSIQRGKRRRGSSLSSSSSPTNDTNNKSIAAAMAEASKNGNLVQEFKRQEAEIKTNEMVSVDNNEGADLLDVLEKRRMRKSFQEADAGYLLENEGTDSISAAAAAAAVATGTVNDGSEIVEEEKKSDDGDKTTADHSPVIIDKPAKLSIGTSELQVASESNITTHDGASASPKSGFPTSQSNEPNESSSPSSSPPPPAPSTSSSKSVSSSSSSSPPSSSPKSSPRKDGKTLSRADPPTLVLARTRWLLKYGESILPPYHAFSSNSECIAVFCKTGYWSTLQADIFLHSTAIGNAKSTVVMTLGVAASVPILAPVVGAVGLGAVVAPWLYLNNQKKAAKDAQQRLTDQFWAQAEPEVFVECIKAWSHLHDGENDDVDEDNDGNDTTTTPCDKNEESTQPLVTMS